MKTIKHLSLTYALLLLIPLFSFGQTESKEVLSFEEAYCLMEENNPGLMRMKEQIKQKEFEQKAKKGMYLPTVSLSAQAVAMSDPIHLDLTPVRDAIVPLYNTLGTYGVFSGVANPDPTTNAVMPVFSDDVSTQLVREQLLEAGETVQSAEWDQMIQDDAFANLSAGFVWPVFAGSKIKSANEAAGIDVDISREELRVTEGQLLTELVTRYYGLALGMQVAKVREQTLVSMENHYRDAEKMFDNGIIAKVELLHARVARNEAEREYKQAKRNVEVIQSGLKATLAKDSIGEIVPASNLFINTELDGLSAWIAKAEASNPQLKQIEGKKQQAEIKHKVEKREYLPTVAMMGNYNIVDKNLSPYMPDWLVGVGMQWTLFDGMSRNQNIRASETLQNQVMYAEQKAHNDLEAYLTKLYEELHMLMEQKTELETTLELAEEYAQSTEKAFSEGLATSNTVVEAQTKVTQVKALRLKVMYDYDVTLAGFLQTSGVPQEFSNFCSGENVVSESL